MIVLILMKGIAVLMQRCCCSAKCDLHTENSIKNALVFFHELFKIGAFEGSFVGNEVYIDYTITHLSVMCNEGVTKSVIITV